MTVASAQVPKRKAQSFGELFADSGPHGVRKRTLSSRRRRSQRLLGFVTHLAEQIRVGVNLLAHRRDHLLGHLRNGAFSYPRDRRIKVDFAWQLVGENREYYRHRGHMAGKLALDTRPHVDARKMHADTVSA